MSALALSIAAIAIVCTFGMTVWVWLAVANAANELLTFVGFDGIHFEE